MMCVYNVYIGECIYGVYDVCIYIDVCLCIMNLCMCGVYDMCVTCGTCTCVCHPCVCMCGICIVCV